MPFDLDRKLPDDIFSSILTYCRSGNERFAHKQYTQAIEEFQRAITAIPPPQEIWHVHTWLTVALAECYFLTSDYFTAKIFFSKVYSLQDPETISPLVHLRLALCYYKLDQIKEANPLLKKSGVPYGIDQLEDPFYWEILNDISIRDDSLPFNTLA